MCVPDLSCFCFILQGESSKVKDDDKAGPESDSEDVLAKYGLEDYDNEEEENEDEEDEEDEGRKLYLKLLERK